MASDNIKQMDIAATPATTMTNRSGTEHLFKKGWAGGPGRPKGVPNKVKADLASMILSAAARTGFIKSDENGKRIGTGLDGCEGYLMWAALYEPRTYLALLAR